MKQGRIAHGDEVIPLDFSEAQVTRLADQSPKRDFDTALPSQVAEHIFDILGHFINICEVLNE